MEYRHTQRGKVLDYVVVWGVLIVAVTALLSDDGFGSTLLVAAFVLVIASIVLVFNRLTVTVGDGKVRAAFGWGWPRRVIDVLDITGFRVVRNPWWYGWGIRKVPGGWMFNVWGLDAVEIDLRSGRKLRIGSDETGDLIAALELHTSQRREG